MRPILFAAAAALLLGSAGAVVAQTAQTAPTPAIAEALADDRRPAEDRERDAARHAAEVLAFAGVAPGQKVADLIMGGGYFTRLFADVVGDEGHVYAWQPAEFIAFQASYGENLLNVSGDYGNVTPLDAAMADVDFPGPLDLAFTAQNYHDLHLDAFPDGTAAGVNAAVFEALRPGGVFLIIDHHALEGSGTAPAESVHRIDRQSVIDEVTAAGFVLEAESDLLANSDDPRTANVFDGSIRGRTDQFMLRFRKPG